MSKILGEYKQEKKAVYNKRFGILFNGSDNYYPLIHQNLIKRSPTAKQCVDIRQSFLYGSGFENEELESFNLTGNVSNIVTPNDFLQELTEEYSENNGCFVHIRYDANFNKVGFKIIPYNLCRIGKRDSSNYSGKIVISPKGWGRYIKKDEVITLDTYNPRENVLRAQIEAAGGFSKWGGQVAFLRHNNKYEYPLSPIDGVEDFCHTESQLGKFYSGTTSRGFSNITIVRVQDSFEGMSYGDFSKDDTEAYSDFRRSQDNLSKVQESFDSLFGIENTGKALVVSDDFLSDENGKGKYRFENIEDNSTPEKYAHFENGAANYIRKSFGIPPQLLDMIEGKLGGTNGGELKIGEAMYNRTIAVDKKRLERFFSELFRGFYVDLGNNWKIGTYSLQDDGTIEEENAVTIEEGGADE